MHKERFTVRMKKAIQIAKAKGAILNGRAVTAQAALESAWAQSLLAARHSNLFGMKAGTSWAGQTVDLWTREWRGRRDDQGRPIFERELAKWKVFPSWNECLVDYSNLIQRRKYYHDTLPFADPPDGNGDAYDWIAHLVDRDEPGELAWATDPNYVAKVMNLLEEMDEEGLL